ncbi:MAG: Asp-tRNA(Asn)/Glu-tRNA(Gln) amidotransferase subunit GatB [Cyclobacteriaceae bacterium]|nr:Asp-tRNA(Asn)/Glu-tRNA(Gln) amidotransferase subunit GatB [Cyclobacteriaceae bacterium]
MTSGSDIYEAVIGLEVHIQLATDSKIFCADGVAFGESPNTLISTISLAHPGTLPKVNKKAIELGIKMGLALGSTISQTLYFDRKHYFYPDLPKGYQLTQDRTPVCIGGQVPIVTKSGLRKAIQLNRIHLEEDAGKLLHDQHKDFSAIDYNRAGTALIEMVTEPVMRLPEEAYAFLVEIRKLVRFLGIGDGYMEEGSLRCDANVSIREKGSSVLNPKVEIKNMNSFKHVQRAIETEIERQITLVQAGQSVVSETRSYDAEKETTFSLRSKETLHDYRYFPDPDLSPVVVDEAWLNQIKNEMGELPQAMFNRFIEKYQLSEYDAGVITDDKDVAQYFNDVVAHTKHYKAAANWVIGPLKSQLRERMEKATTFPVQPVTLAKLINLVEEGKVSYTMASQKIFPELLLKPNQSPLELAQALNLLLENNVDALTPVIDEVIKIYPLKVEEYKQGKKGIVDMFMGEVMKRTKGKADPKKANQLIIEKLKSL